METCDVCGKHFLNATKLKTHRQGVHGDKRYGCDICQKRFTLPCRLKKHIKCMHGTKEESTIEPKKELPLEVQQQITDYLQYVRNRIDCYMYESTNTKNNDERKFLESLPKLLLPS